MGSIISKIAGEIALHGSYEAYCAWRDRPDDDILYFPDPEVVERPEVRVPSNGREIESFFFDEIALPTRPAVNSKAPRNLPGGKQEF